MIMPATRIICGGTMLLINFGALLFNSKYQRRKSMRVFNYHRVVTSFVIATTILLCVAPSAQVSAESRSGQQVAQSDTTRDESGKAVVLPQSGTKKNVVVEGKPDKPATARDESGKAVVLPQSGTKKNVVVEGKPEKPLKAPN